MFEFLKSLFAEEETGTSIWCRECKNNLCADDSFISDAHDENGDNHVKYKCEKCGDESDYNFDIAPCPINWKDLCKKTA